MKFGEETVRKAAELARLDLSDEEIRRFAGQLSSIVQYVHKLNELDTTNVEPMSHALDLETPMRDDVARPSPGAPKMLATAPEELYESFKVPQVLGGGH